MNSPTKLAAKIFQQGSTTFFYSSIFFPSSIRVDVFDLYAFVRKADDYVDQKSPQKKEYLELKRQCQQALAGEKVDDEVAARFANLCLKLDIPKKWIDAFFSSMEMDLDNKQYQSMDDTLEYIFGSAEVIGLCMSRIMGLSQKAEESARMLGRAFQYINFIRDIDEDNELGRRYFPKETLDTYQLKELTYHAAIKQRKQFAKFLRDQIKLYQSWTKEASKGFRYIPTRFRIPIQTASKMYLWTASILHKDPLMVFCHKVKPSKYQVMRQIIYETVSIKFIPPKLPAK